jgi:hypothetical protein
MADILTRADIAEADGGRIVAQASIWKDTPYAPNIPGDRYKGAGAVNQNEADCSGSVWKIYCTVGYRYEYTPSFAYRWIRPDAAFAISEIIA